ncbi:MAG: SET domain-containing protein [Flavobacteriales bacterium]
MIHPDTEVRFISDEIGYGVVATRLIPKGTITWVADKLDRVFTQEEFNQMDSIYQDILEKYTFRDKDGKLILCWDNARFVNHSFNSSCVSTAYNFEIAVRDIHPGEQLTDDYGYLNVSEPFDCITEEGSDRTAVYPDDLLKYHSIWDAKVEEAIQFTPKLEQPLKNLLENGVWNKVLRIANREEKLQSILSCYYNPVY